MSRRTSYALLAHDTRPTAINDILTVGATPISVHAYWASGGSDRFDHAARARDLVDGWRAACDRCGVALQQPGPARPEPGSDSPTPASDAFIGRERELQAIGKFLARALSGNGATVAIAGEPGIGKTQTAQVVSQWAAIRGMQVLWGRCNEEPGAPPEIIA